MAFKPREDVDDFALRLNTLQQKMVQFDDDTYGDKRAVEKLFRCIIEKYKQITRSIESLLDLSTMSIEEAIGHLKIIDGDEPQPLSRSIRSHISLRNSGRPVRVTGRSGSPLPRWTASSAAMRARRVEVPRPGHEDMLRVAPTAAPPASRSRH
jgi:hypothetical protein